jgi:septin 7
MVVGESGLGKSTLINTLFNANLYPNKTVSITTELQKSLDIQQISAGTFPYLGCISIS